MAAAGFGLGSLSCFVYGSPNTANGSKRTSLFGWSGSVLSDRIGRSAVRIQPTRRVFGAAMELFGSFLFGQISFGFHGSEGVKFLLCRRLLRIFSWKSDAAGDETGAA